MEVDNLVLANSEYLLLKQGNNFIPEIKTPITEIKQVPKFEINLSGSEIIILLLSSTIDQIFVIIQVIDSKYTILSSNEINYTNGYTINKFWILNFPELQLISLSEKRKDELAQICSGYKNKEIDSVFMNKLLDKFNTPSVNLEVEVFTYTCDDKRIPWDEIFKTLNDYDLNYYAEKISGLKNPIKLTEEQLTDQAIDFINGIRSMIIEQRSYHNTCNNNGCQIWFTYATINGLPYGGIFSFYKPGADFMIQGISIFFGMGRFMIRYPELSKNFPRLNSVLIPEVEKLAKTIGANRIIVIPVRSQKKILLEHYGFKAISGNWKIPCINIIMDSFDPIEGVDYSKNNRVLVKSL